MLTTIPTSATRPFAWRTAVLLARLRRLINRFFAAVIARHERHAARRSLRRLDDRQLSRISAMYPLADRQQARRAGADPRANAAARLALTGGCVVEGLLSAYRLQLMQAILSRREQVTAARRVRATSEFLQRLQLDLPRPVSLAKNSSASRSTQITRVATTTAILSHSERGVSRSSRTLGAGCDGRGSVGRVR